MTPEGAVESGTVVTFGGERLELLAERAAWWAARRALLVADLHWGKSETMRGAGAPIPGGVLGEQLARLDRAIGRTGAARVLVLGDLLHHACGMTAGLIERVGVWRATHPGVSLEVVPGNHDRGLARVAGAWAMEVLAPEVAEGGLVLRHDPRGGGRGVVLGGHEHPAVRVAGGKKMACFRFGVRVGVLPAFSAFTAGATFRRRPRERVFVPVEGRVVEI